MLTYGRNISIFFKLPTIAKLSISIWIKINLINLLAHILWCLCWWSKWYKWSDYACECEVSELSSRSTKFIDNSKAKFWTLTKKWWSSTKDQLTLIDQL